MNRLFFFAFCCSALFAQSSGPNVRFTQWLQPTTVAEGDPTLILNSAALPNIGQSSHSAQITISCAGVQAYGLVARVQGSADNSNWFNIGPRLNIGSLDSGSTYNVLGYGAYPYIRVSGQFDNDMSNGFSCTVTGYYSGNSSPTYVLADSLLTYPLVQNLFFSAPQITTIASGGGLSIAVYGLTVTAPNTVTAITMSCTGGANLTLSPVPSSMVLSVGLRPYLQCPPNAAFNVNAVGTGQGNVNVFYRLE